MFGALDRLGEGRSPSFGTKLTNHGRQNFFEQRFRGRLEATIAYKATRHSHSRKSQRRPRTRPNYLEFIAPPPTIAGEESRVNVTGPINSAGIDAGPRVLVCQTIIDAN